MDWTKYNDSETLIIEDDASRFMEGMEIYNEETTENTMETLEIAIIIKTKYSYTLLFYDWSILWRYKYRWYL